MTCQQCGKAFPPDTDPHRKYCADCARQRRLVQQYTRLRAVVSSRTCLKCGGPLPEGCSASKQYCDECARKRNIELTMKRQEQARKMRVALAAQRQSNADKAWCKPCQYRATSDDYLCNYFIITGKRRGCPAGNGCGKRRKSA